MRTTSVDVQLPDQLVDRLVSRYGTDDPAEAVRNACYEARIEAAPRDQSTEVNQNAVFVYHDVGGDRGDGYGRSFPPTRFQLELETFQAAGYEIVDVPTVLETADGPGTQIALTFDDALDSFYRQVKPLLERYELPATLYVPTDVIGKEGHLTEDELVELADHNLVTIGNHTQSHPLLPEVADEATLRTEIIGAQQKLEELLGITIDQFCYPCYKFDDRSIDIVSESHDLAVAGPPGHPIIGGDELGPETDPYRIPRLDGVTYSELSLGMGIDRFGMPILNG